MANYQQNWKSESVWSLPEKKYNEDDWNERGWGGEEGAEGGAVGHCYKKEVEERCFNNWT